MGKEEKEPLGRADSVGGELVLFFMTVFADDDDVGGRVRMHGSVECLGEMKKKVHVCGSLKANVMPKVWFLPEASRMVRARSPLKIRMHVNWCAGLRHALEFSVAQYFPSERASCRITQRPSLVALANCCSVFRSRSGPFGLAAPLRCQ